MFSCYDCKEQVSEPKLTRTREKGKNERNEEEEFDRVPIAGEDERDYDDVVDYLWDSDDDWLDDGENKEATNYLAFAIGPTRDEKVRPKQTPLLSDFISYNQYAILQEIQEGEDLPTTPQTWTTILLQAQKAYLKMRYKRIRK
jgi:hypothetical protein